MSRWKSTSMPGIKPEWGKAAFDFGGLWYAYPGAIPRPLGYQYVELKAGVSLSPLDKLKMTPTFWYVPALERCDRDLYV